MYIRNWMLPVQVSVDSEALATEAELLIREHNLKIIPVVDEGRLRGVLHRRDLSEAALCVSGSGDLCEMNYFCNKLQVKDLMVRMPLTVSVDNTVGEVLLKGRQHKVSSFPVMDGDKVVGLVSDREIFVTLFKILEAGEERTEITLQGVKVEKGTLTSILKIVDDLGAIARSIFTVKDGGGHDLLVLRLQCDNPQEILDAFRKGGFEILEASSSS